MTFAQLRLYGEAEKPQSFEEAIEIAKRQRRAGAGATPSPV